LGAFLKCKKLNTPNLRELFHKRKNYTSASRSVEEMISADNEKYITHPEDCSQLKNLLRSYAIF